ncbi:pimeloyl-ACP methyl ester carboxylesterase [Oxalobacteraceae bacterium GrIS 1.11]
MPLPLVPIVTVIIAMTLRSDTKPVKVYVKKPRGTLYWGGAGLDGPYIKPQIAAFGNAGIKNISVGLTNTATREFPDWLSAVGTPIDALRSGLLIRFEDNDDWVISSGMNTTAPQFNIIGYSYGSLLAAQTAWFYAKQGNIVDHLVLIGSPIDGDFLAKLKAHKNIKKVVIIDLLTFGDKIYAGIPEKTLIESAPILVKQMTAGQGEGHFYYAHITKDSPRRWKELAERLYSEGLR